MVEDICKEHYKGFGKTFKRIVGEVGSVFTGLFYSVKRDWEYSFKYNVGKLERLKKQVNELEAKIKEDEEKVQQYDALKSKYDKVEIENRGLSERNSKLEDLCGLKNQTIRDLRIKLRKKSRETLGIIEDGYRQRTETSKLSYIIIGGSGKIIATTKAFKKQFHFNEEDLIGNSYFGALKIPEDALDYIHDFKKIVRNPEKVKLPTTIINGKGEEKMIVFEKEEPVSVEDYFYTKVHVHEVGAVKRIAGKIIRTLYFLGKEAPKPVHELIAAQEVHRIAKESEEEKKDILKED